MTSDLLTLFNFLIDSYCLGIYEALELRDGGSDYLGKGVLKVFFTHSHFFDVYTSLYKLAGCIHEVIL